MLRDVVRVNNNWPWKARRGWRL